MPPCSDLLLRTLVLSALCLVSCQSDGRPASQWPPEDFRIRAETCGEDGAVYRSFLVFADGLAIYRESDRTVVDGSIPVFSTVAVYRLDPRTTRTLCRELDRADVFAPTRPEDLNRPSVGATASVAWWARGSSGFVSRQQLDRGPLERALRVCDAYLPEARTLSDGESAGVRRVDEVPGPLEDLRGALAAHAEVVRQRSVDADFLREVFAIALELREFAIAEAAIDEIEALGPRGALGEPVDPAAWREFELGPLRRALRAAEGGGA
ncbi:MAG: hypothetical protein O2865_03410 [Planctomycetota bacterium]|nr:hypothetical protein [Planctomycetota bacterium]MDA0934113.1 hypothetical protein [Planctomycetota bacterium]MDA1222172.1 hypothetical protein [Planctomycetota bacterium]